MQIAERTKVGRMSVPGRCVGIAIGDRRPVHLHETRARFDEPACHQTSLSEGVPAVFIAHLVRLLGQIKRVARAAREHQVERFLVVFIQRVTGNRFLHFGHGFFDFLEQRGAPFHPLLRDALAQREVVQFYLPGRVLIKVIGIEGRSEETGGAAFADHVALLQRAREHDERQHRTIQRFEPDDLRTGVRKIIRRGRLELAGG